MLLSMRVTQRLTFDLSGLPKAGPLEGRVSHQLPVLLIDGFEICLDFSTHSRVPPSNASLRRPGKFLRSLKDIATEREGRPALTSLSFRAVRKQELQPCNRLLAPCQELRPGFRLRAAMLLALKRSLP